MAVVKKNAYGHGAILVAKSALAEDAKERYPFRPRRFQTQLKVDGSVIDQ